MCKCFLPITLLSFDFAKNIFSLTPVTLCVFSDNSQYLTLQRNLWNTAVDSKHVDGNQSSQIPLKQLPNRKLCRQFLENPKNKNCVDILKRHLVNSIKGSKQAAQKNCPSKSGSVLAESKQSKELLLIPEDNYQLSERVLQWLDLAGKGPENIFDSQSENLTQNKATASNRRIFTALPNGLKKHDSHAVLKRTESIHHLSLTLNEEELANSSRNSRKEVHNPFPITYLSARKLRQMSSTSKTKQTQPAAAGASSSQAIGANINNNNSKPSLVMSPKSTTSSTASTSANTATANNPSPNRGSKNRKSIGKLGKTESIENQYRSMIHRQLIQTSCNTHFAKKQLHIFMPNMPSNRTGTGGHPNPDCNSVKSDISKV